MDRDDGVLDMADGGGEVGLLRDGISGARLMLGKGWMEAAMRGTWLI
jgi:hypothetical protein